MLPTAFTKTLRALDGSRTGPALVRLFVALALLGAIGYWMTQVPVTLYAVTGDARLEVEGAATVVQALTAGRVVEADLALGKHVVAGDILVRLDALPEQLQKGEEQAKIAAIGPEVQALRAQIAAEAAAGTEEKRSSQSSLQEARLRVEEAGTPAKLAELERARFDALYKEGLTTRRDFDRAVSDAERTRNAVATTLGAIDRLEREQGVRDRERLVRVAALETQISRLESTRPGMEASMRRVTYDVERRVIRAPVTGTIGEAATLRVGSVLQESTRITSIVPAGRLRIVASFLPETAHGRLKPGQNARLRLKGYPWTEFGVVEAVVAEVAGDDREGHTRVELNVLPSPRFRVNLRHGMPGELEIEVERTPPAALVLRQAGQWMTAGGPQPQ